MAASATRSIGVAPAPRADRERVPVAGRPRAIAGADPRDQGRRSRARRTPKAPMSRARVQDPHGSARRQALAVPRLLRHVQADTQVLQRRPARRKERVGQVALAPGQDAEARRGARSRRDRRGRQAEGDADRATRCATRPQPVDPAAASSSPSRRSPSRSSRRAAATRTRSPTRSPGWPRRTRRSTTTTTPRPSSSSSRASASSTSRSSSSA